MTTIAALPLTFAGAIADPKLLGGLRAFRDLSTWSRWVVFLRALEGLPLDDAQQAIFREHTSRTVYDPPVGGWREALALVGRQSGKSQIAGAIQAVSAIRATQDPALRGSYSLTVAQDSRSAMRAVHAYATAPFDLPLFARLVTARAADALTLANGVRLATYPCKPSAVRGVRCVSVTLDEASFYFTSESNPVDVEMYRAVRPAILTTQGRITILTSAYFATGLVPDLVAKNQGDDAAMLIWRASSPEMNPTIDVAYLARLRESDPEAYESEILSEFRSGLAVLFDDDALRQCVDVGTHERPRIPGVAYTGGVDLSGGRRDRAALAFAHRVGDVSVLDLLRVWPSPHDPAQVIGEMSEACRAYGVIEPRADRYAAEFAVSAFRERGVTLRPTTLDRSGLYLGLLPLVNSHRVRLLDHGLLLKELKGLVRRRGSSGHDRVDHRHDGHDDAANAVAIALTAGQRPTDAMLLNLWTGQLTPAREHEARMKASRLGLPLGDIMGRG